jgi:hypothetical protein
MSNLFSIFSAVVYFLLQVIFIRHWALFDVGFCFVYISMLLFLPIVINPLLIMVIGFGYGLFIDLFYDTIGIHAASCVLLCYSRSFITNLIKPSGGYDANAKPLLNYMGAQWFITYTFLLTTMHHIPLFFLEAWGVNMWFFTLLKAISSIFFTSSVIILFQYLFYRNA